MVQRTGFRKRAQPGDRVLDRINKLNTERGRFGRVVALSFGKLLERLVVKPNLNQGRHSGMTSSKFSERIFGRTKLGFAGTHLLKTAIDLAFPRLLNIGRVIQRFLVEACDKKLGEPRTFGNRKIQGFGLKPLQGKTHDLCSFMGTNPK
jgi:hypothetical protein